MSPEAKVESLPGGDRIAKKLRKIHASKRTVRKVLDEVEKQAADDEHAVDLINALSDDGELVPRPTRDDLISLIQSDCVTKVLSLKAKSVFKGCLF